MPVTSTRLPTVRPSAERLPARSSSAKRAGAMLGYPRRRERYALSLSPAARGGSTFMRCAATTRPVFPEGVFVLAASLRLITVVVLCGFVIRDILHPERDAVRDTYADDPDGGVLDGAPDAPWYQRWRPGRTAGDHPAELVTA